jgi:hypothetical protein
MQEEMKKRQGGEKKGGLGLLTSTISTLRKTQDIKRQE